MARKKTAKKTNVLEDLFTISEPKQGEKRRNKLYFTETTNKATGKVTYGWTLKSVNGKIIGASTESYSKKIYAIRNVGTLFGLELLEGKHSLHVIPDEERSVQLSAEVVKQLGKKK